jgi:hypothetical protein
MQANHGVLRWLEFDPIICNRTTKSLHLTDHAILRCKDRGISARQVLQCLKRRHVCRSNGGQTMRYQIQIPGQGHAPRFLHVVAKKKSSLVSMKILTAYWRNSRVRSDSELFRRHRNRKQKASMKHLLIQPQRRTKVQRHHPCQAALKVSLPSQPLPPSMHRCRLDIQHYATASTAKWSIITLPVDPTSQLRSEPAHPLMLSAQMKCIPYPQTTPQLRPATIAATSRAGGPIWSSMLRGNGLAAMPAGKQSRRKAKREGFTGNIYGIPHVTAS